MKIAIRDNGIGLQEPLGFEHCRGIGIRNVHERIQLYCGTDYGVKVANHPDGGTEAVLIVPLIRNETELRLLGGVANENSANG